MAPDAKYMGAGTVIKCFLSRPWTFLMSKIKTREQGKKKGKGKGEKTRNYREKEKENELDSR